MTREEAIQALKDISWQMGSVKRWENIEALDMAIEALSIDVSQLNFGTPITMTESLADVSPMKWSKEVLNGEKKVEVKVDFGVRVKAR